MSNAAALLIGIVWLSLIGLAVAYLITRRPVPKKPLERDALEATDAALRLRIIDLEDKFEAQQKRNAVRAMRERREEQLELPLAEPDRKTRLAAVRARAAAAGLVRGGIHGTAG